MPTIQMRKLSLWFRNLLKVSQLVNEGRIFAPTYLWLPSLGISSAHLHCPQICFSPCCFLLKQALHTRWQRWPPAGIEPASWAILTEKAIHRCARMWPEKVKRGHGLAPGHCGEHGRPWKVIPGLTVQSGALCLEAMSFHPEREATLEYLLRLLMA